MAVDITTPAVGWRGFAPCCAERPRAFPRSWQWTASTPQHEIRITALAPLGERVSREAGRVRGLPCHLRNSSWHSRSAETRSIEHIATGPVIGSKSSVEPYPAHKL